MNEILALLSGTEDDQKLSLLRLSEMSIPSAISYRNLCHLGRCPRDPIE